MNEILKIDKNHRGAAQYINRSNSALTSIRQIRMIVEQERKAEEDAELPLLLSYIGNQDLHRQRDAEARNLFNTYDNIRSVVEMDKVKIIFNGLNDAIVTFPKLITAKVKRTGTSTEWFSGEIIWKMRKQGNLWKIIDYIKKNN